MTRLWRNTKLVDNWLATRCHLDIIIQTTLSINKSIRRVTHQRFIISLPKLLFPKTWFIASTNSVQLIKKEHRTVDSNASIVYLILADPNYLHRSGIITPLYGHLLQRLNCSHPSSPTVSSTSEPLNSKFSMQLSPRIFSVLIENILFVHLIRCFHRWRILKFV